MAVEVQFIYPSGVEDWFILPKGIAIIPGLVVNTDIGQFKVSKISLYQNGANLVPTIYLEELHG
jgi:hypothetical protein